MRVTRFKDQIRAALAEGGLEVFRSLIEDIERDDNVPAIDIAAALAKLARGDEPLLLTKPDREARPEFVPSQREFGGGVQERAPRAPRGDWEERPARPAREPGFKKERVMRDPEPGMATFRIEVGFAHGAKPGNIVGAIANEANIPSKHIGRIEIYDDYSTLDLPDDMPKDLVEHLKTIWVAGRQLAITRDGETPATPAAKKPYVAKGVERRMGEKPSAKKPHRKGQA